MVDDPLYLHRALFMAAISIVVFASASTFEVAAGAHVGVCFALSFHALGYYHGLGRHLHYGYTSEYRGTV